MVSIGRRSKWRIVAAIGVSAALALTACSSSGSGAGGSGTTKPSGGTSASGGGSGSGSGGGAGSWSKYHFTYANGSSSGSIGVTIRDGVKDAAKKLGVKYSAYENNGDGPTALTNARLMIQEHPDLIIEYNLAEGIGPSLGKQLTNSKIPCISVNVQTPGCPWINLSNKISGQGAGDIIAGEAQKRGWTKDNTTVLVVQCSTCGVEINDSPRYFYLTVAQKLGMPVYSPDKITAQTTTLGPNLYQVDDQDLSLDKAYRAVQTALQSIPANRHLLVFAINDDASLGAWRAIAAAKRGGNTLIGGLSGLPEGLSQLRTNPSWVAEGSLFLPFWGEYVMAMAVAVLQGAKPPELTPFPQITMDKTTVNKYYPNGSNDAKLLPALTADNQYLAKSGVLQFFNNVDGLTK
jgi:ribose transport system substrate-binding protein